MDEDETEYFYRRALEEVTLACKAADEKEVTFHYELANLYLDRVYAPEISRGS